MFYTKLSKMPYAQAKVAVINSATKQSTLISYQTQVAHITKEGYLIVNGLYSATTRKHIGAYVKEYANTDYYTAKRCYKENLVYHIRLKCFISRETGEVIE